MKKTVRIILSSALLFSLASFIAIEIYTEQMKQKIVNRIVQFYYPYYDGSEYIPKLRPIQLYNFLSANIAIQEPETNDPESEWHWNKDYTIRYPIYKKNWRDVVAKNPDLIITAWNLYGEGAILALNSKLGYYSKNKITGYEQYQNNGFNTVDFWKVQKSHQERYNKLIDELLKLDEKKLNYFINSSDMDDDALSYDFITWLNEKGLLDQTYVHNYYPNNPEKPNNCYMYPGDLILLTKRICLDYPQWTPRNFLTECKRFNNIVLKTINSIYP